MKHNQSNRATTAAGLSACLLAVALAATHVNAGGDPELDAPALKAEKIKQESNQKQAITPAPRPQKQTQKETKEAAAPKNRDAEDRDGALEPLMDKGRQQRQAKDHLAALKTYDEILKVDPTNESARFYVALLTLQAARETEPDIAVPLYRRATNFFPDDASIKADLFTATLKSKEHRDTAFEAYNSLPADQRTVALSMDVATCCVEAGRYQEAVDLYRDVLKGDPKHAAAAVGLVETLLRGGEDAKALQAANAALADQPENCDVRVIRLSLLWRDGQVKPALDEAEAVLKLNPTRKTAHDIKARALSKLGFHSLAVSWKELHAKEISDEGHVELEAALRAARARWTAAEEREARPTPPPGTCTTICYLKVGADEGPSVDQFIDEIEYFRDRGFQIINAAELPELIASGSTPDNSVLIAFRDGHRSIAKHAAPVLKRYGISALLLLCTSRVDSLSDEQGELMTWKEIRQLAVSGHFVLGSETHALDKRIPFTPQGDTGPSGAVRAWDLTQGYESDEAYTKRLAADLIASRKSISQHTGQNPVFLAWPYDRYTKESLDLAAKHKFQVVLDGTIGPGNAAAPFVQRAWNVGPNASLEQFLKGLSLHHSNTRLPGGPTRAAHLSLDLVHDESDTVRASNLKRAADRFEASGVSRVYVQAFADPDQDGQTSAVYFPNNELPVRSDILAHACEVLRGRGLEVYVCLPLLSYELPNRDRAERLSVMELTTDGPHVASATVRRLSPFEPEAQTFVASLCADLATHAFFDGVMFEDDGYLTDSEDFSPAACDAIQNNPEFAGMSLEEVMKAGDPWTRVKTQQIDVMVENAMAAIRTQRHRVKFGRTLYAPAVHYPQSAEWLAQNYTDALGRYDWVVILAYPQMEGADNPVRWLKTLVEAASVHPGALDKTVFELQSHNWSKSRWIPVHDLVRQIRAMVSAGAKHISYYPDDFLIDRPELSELAPALTPPKKAK